MNNLEIPCSGCKFPVIMGEGRILCARFTDGEITHVFHNPDCVDKWMKENEDSKHVASILN